jgi:hypothetical protein
MLVHAAAIVPPALPRAGSTLCSPVQKDQPQINAENLKKK